MEDENIYTALAFCNIHGIKIKLINLKNQKLISIKLEVKLTFVLKSKNEITKVLESIDVKK